jgi:hypothetical protein
LVPIAVPLNSQEVKVQLGVDANTHQKAEQLVDFFHSVLVPALALLATGAAKVVVSRLQDHSNVRRSVELTKRISDLETTISTLPKRDNTEMEITPHMVLTDELKQAIAELKYLQTRVHYSFHQFCSDVSFRTRRAFVLYHPRGFVGYLLHSLFYGYIAMMLFFVAVIALPSPQETSVPSKINPAITSDAPPASVSNQTSGAISYPAKEFTKAGSFVTEMLAFMLMFGVLSIPALILRHFALKRIDSAMKAPPEADNTSVFRPALGSPGQGAAPSQPS